MANTTLALYYDPDLDPETKAGVRQAFVRALLPKPVWAVAKAFDAWTRTMQRRPSPGEIVILADREIEPISNELRRREMAEREAEAWRREEQRRIPTPEEANAIMAASGFTPARMDALRHVPQAMTFAEAEERVAAPPVQHWSETADPDSPEWRALQAARDANPLIREMREAAARRAAKGAA